MKTRVLTALVAIPLVLAVVGCTNPWPLAVLCIALAAVASAELAALLESDPLTWGLCSGLAIAMFSFRLIVSPVNDLLHPAGVVFCSTGYFIGLVCSVPRLRGADWPFLLPGIALIVCAPIMALVFLKGGNSQTHFAWQLANPLILVLLPVWAGDSAAMLGGKAFGKHKLAPTISPNKTWEGAICNFAASVLGGWGVGAWLGYEWWVGLACGAAVGIFGQLGDLFESALKRAAGKKDSGTLLPGHGGVLDRIDALLGAVIPVWLILHFSGSLS